jgi:hypothetical protein
MLQKNKWTRSTDTSSKMTYRLSCPCGFDQSSFNLHYCKDILARFQPPPLFLWKLNPASGPGCLLISISSRNNSDIREPVLCIRDILVRIRNRIRILLFRQWPTRCQQKIICRSLAYILILVIPEMIQETKIHPVGSNFFTHHAR